MLEDSQVESSTYSPASPQRLGRLLKLGDDDVDEYTSPFTKDTFELATWQRVTATHKEHRDRAQQQELQQHSAAFSPSAGTSPSAVANLFSSQQKDPSYKGKGTLTAPQQPVTAVTVVDEDEYEQRDVELPIIRCTGSSILEARRDPDWGRATSWRMRDIIRRYAPGTPENAAVRDHIAAEGARFVSDRFTSSAHFALASLPGGTRRYVAEAIQSKQEEEQQSYSAHPHALHDHAPSTAAVSSPSRPPLRLPAITAPSPTRMTSAAPLKKNTTAATTATGSASPSPSSSLSVKAMIRDFRTNGEQSAVRRNDDAIQAQRPPSPTSMPLPLTGDIDYSEKFREAAILNEEQAIRGEISAGFQRDYTNHITYISSVMTAMSEGRFLEEHDKKLLVPTHSHGVLQLMSRLKRETLPLMFVRHPEPGEESDEDSEDDDDDDDEDADTEVHAITGRASSTSVFEGQ